MLKAQETEEQISFLNDSYFVPHFQPIVNVINRTIMAYEVLGRYYSSEEKEFKSLGTFFHDSKIDFSQTYKIDKIIREKAFRHLSDSKLNTKLFFNMMPSYLSRIHKDDLSKDRFHILQLIEKYNIDTSNIVIEITEDEFNGSIDKLVEIIDVFRKYGLKIAVDDLGIGFSNLERIGYIHPDIIKVDIQFLRQSVNKNSFFQVLNAISEMSNKLGSQLLFEGIETEEEVNLALSMGANLMQGYFFSPARPEFLNRNVYSDKIKDLLEYFAGIRFLEILHNSHKEQKLVDSLNALFQGTEWNVKHTDSIIATFTNLISEIPSQVRRIFLCDLYGYQITPTFQRTISGALEERGSGMGNNYAWKPYFIRHKAESYHHGKPWNITDPQYDIKNQSQYVIFTYSVSPEVILVAQVDWN